jgi:regulator of sigma E protease
MEFIPDFGGLAFTLVAFIAALSIIVAIHEYGHYIVGRWSGIHAEVFSIGFGPVLFARTDRHGTKWQLAALPFGGYVKFLGDSDAASGKDAAAIDALDVEERRRSMHGAPLWARSATVAAGPVFNFILSILIFASVLMIAGRPAEEPVVGTPAALPADMATLEAGDLITSIDGTPIATLGDVFSVARQLPPTDTVTYGLERDGQAQSVEASFPLLPIVQSVTPQSAAMDAGLQEGDVIRAVDGTPIHAFSQLREAVDASDGAPLALSVWRQGETLDITLSPRRTDLPLPEGGFETRWLIGITGGLIFDPETVRVGPGDAIWGRGGADWVHHPLVAFWAVAHDHGRDFVVQPARPHRDRGDQRRGGEPGDRRFHLVHRGPVDGGRALLNLCSRSRCWTGATCCFTPTRRWRASRRRRRRCACS